MVEGAPLLREYRHKKLIEGSNPSLSAKSFRWLFLLIGHLFFLLVIQSAYFESFEFGFSYQSIDSSCCLTATRF